MLRICLRLVITYKDVDLYVGPNVFTNIMHMVVFLPDEKRGTTSTDFEEEHEMKKNKNDQDNEKQDTTPTKENNQIHQSSEKVGFLADQFALLMISGN